VGSLLGQEVSELFDESVSARGAREHSLALDALATSQHVAPTSTADDLALDVWESDDELDAFLDDVRRSRHADVA
jgi:hypothetical protein